MIFPIAQQLIILGMSRPHLGSPDPTQKQLGTCQLPRVCKQMATQVGNRSGLPGLSGYIPLSTRYQCAKTGMSRAAAALASSPR